MEDKDFEARLSDSVEKKLATDWEQEHAPYSVAGVELAPIPDKFSECREMIDLLQGQGDRLREAIGPLTVALAEKDERIRQLKEQVLKLKCDLDWVADESKEYREKWERQCRLSMERLEEIRKLGAENARLIVAAEKNRLDAWHVRDELERIADTIECEHPEDRYPAPVYGTSAKEACEARVNHKANRAFLKIIRRILAVNADNVRVGLEAGGKRDDLITHLTDENQRLTNERADANRARGALEAQNERLSAENARLRESLQTHNNAGIDVTMQLHALREVVAGLADEWRKAVEASKTKEIALPFGRSVFAHCADQLEAILKGAGNE